MALFNGNEWFYHCLLVIKGLSWLYLMVMNRIYSPVSSNMATPELRSAGGTVI